MYTPDEIAEHQFLISLRGYDRDEVSAFLDEVAGQVRTLQERVAELGAEAPTEAVPPSPRSFKEVGEETARILEAAEEAAVQMRSRAERDAAELREQAEREATEQREQAEQEATELVEEARRKAQEEQDRANQTATEVLEDARRSARETLDTAEQEEREISERVSELQELRARIQADLEAVAETVGVALDRLGEAPSEGAPAAPVEPTAEPAEEVEVPGPGPAVVPEVEEDVAEEPPAAGEPTPEPAPAETAVDETVVEDASVEDVAAEEVDDDEGGPAPAVADVASRELRDQALAGIRPGMRRRLKRTLQDVQNGALDALRRGGTDADVTSLLPGDDELASLLSVGEAFLGEAYRAGLGDGATLAAVPLDEDAADPERVAAAAAEFRATVGHETVAALEPSLAAGLEAGEDESALVDRISEVFRDLKGPVAESATESSLLRIYELGTHDVWLHAGVGTRVWVPGEEARCPENRCRANADEGPVPLDRPFASGDVVPPAHRGCTCTLAPS